MKPSKDSVWLSMLGAVCMAIGWVGTMISGEMEFFILGIGLLNIFWIMGIHKDLYKEEEGE